MKTKNPKSWMMVAALATAFGIASGQTNVSGLISSNTTWTLAGSPYIVTGNILVNNGVTLTIEPGVTVKFDTTKTLQIDGELIAIGTAQNRITFTASDSTPVRGSWGRIQFSPNSTSAVFDTAGNYVSGSVFMYCDILYGGGVSGDVTLFCDASAPYFSHCRISDCLKHAIYFAGAVGKVESSSIKNCGGTALSYVSPNSNDLIVKKDTFEDNGGGVIRSGTGSFASITIQDCIFTRSGAAVDVNGSANALIVNNVFTSNSRAIEGDLGINAAISDNTFIGQTVSVLGAWKCVSCGIFSCNRATLEADSLTVTNNYFENNNGAIYALVAYSLVQGNTFLNNQLMYTIDCEGLGEGGVLVQLDGGPGLIINNFFQGNIGSRYFGGLIQINGAWEIANNIFQNNLSGSIGGSNRIVQVIGTANICSNRFINNSGSAIGGFFVSAAPAFIHHNDFINNSGGKSLIFSENNNSTVHNNVFEGNTSALHPMIDMYSQPFTITYNKFTNNVTGGYPIIAAKSNNTVIRHNRFLNNQVFGSAIITVSNNNSNIHHNEFRDNLGTSCVRITGSTVQPVVELNNFMNPDVQYEIENLIPFGASNLNIDSNYWGTTNTAHIDSVIKDFFDDGNLSIAIYLPVLASPAFVDTVDTSQCYSGNCFLVARIDSTITCLGDSNGVATAIVLGGIPPFSFVWSNGQTAATATGLSAGTYYVTVTDSSGCTATALVNVPDGTLCDDGDACTTDACDQLIGCTTTQIACDDGDSCTADSCQNGSCQFIAIPGCSNPCDTINCDDGDSCTADSCQNGSCQFTAIPGCGNPCDTVNCDDGDSCTTDLCQNGFCFYFPVIGSGCGVPCDAAICYDADVCTIDSCIAFACFYIPIICDDSDACTTDGCDALTGCIATLIICDDGDACTADTCDAQAGCTFTIIPGCIDPCDTLVCDDGDLCTADSCINGICSFTAIVCDDGDLCTTDTCTGGNCIYTNISGCHNPCDTLVCDDGNICTRDGCFNGACFFINDVCVWPGDANSDGIANNFDILAIGIGYGNSGPARPNATTNWIGQACPDWQLQFLSGVNLKHADCDGSGLIDSNDVQAILLNYGLTHAKNSSSQRAVNPDLFLVFPQDSFQTGDTVTGEIHLGTQSTPVNDIYGIAFSLTYNQNVIDSNGITVDFINSWFTPQSNRIGLAKDLYTASRTDIGLSRISHTNASGSGAIANVSFVIQDNIDGKDYFVLPLEIQFEDVVAIDKDETAVNITANGDTLYVEGYTTGVVQFPPNHNIRIFPNPATNEIKVIANVAIVECSILDITGREILKEIPSASGTMESLSFAIDISSLASGSYFIQLKTADHYSVCRKIIVCR